MLKTLLRNQTIVGRVGFRSFSIFGKKNPPNPADIPNEPPKTNPQPPTTPSINVDAVKTTTVGKLEIPLQAGKSIVSTYGLALLHAANSSGQVEAVEQDAKAIIASLKHPDLQELGVLFTDRSITSRERAIQIKPYLSAFSPITQNLINENADSPRGVLIPKMLNEFLRYLKEARKEYEVVLNVGPDGITEEELDEAFALAEEKIGRGEDTQIDLIEEVDEKITSGYALVLPDKYVDRAVSSDPAKEHANIIGGLNLIEATVMRDLGFGKAKYEDFIGSLYAKYSAELLESLEQSISQKPATVELDSTKLLSTLNSEIDELQQQIDSSL